MLKSNEDNFKGWSILESENSPILIAKKEVLLANKTIVLLSDMTGEERKFVEMTMNKGGRM